MNYVFIAATFFVYYNFMQDLRLNYRKVVSRLLYSYLKGFFYITSASAPLNTVNVCELNVLKVYYQLYLIRAPDPSRLTSFLKSKISYI